MTTVSKPLVSSRDSYKVGDRVVLCNLKKSSHLNGLHGHIGSIPAAEGHLAINLDLLVTEIVALKPHNLRREPPLLKRYRPPVQNGCLEEHCASVVMDLLDYSRILVGDHMFTAKQGKFYCTLKQMHLLPPKDRQNHMKLHKKLSNIAWSIWSSPSLSTCEWTFFDFVRNSLDTKESEKDSPQWQTYAQNACKDKACAKSWHLRIEGEFWVVGYDHEGNYLIPKDNEDQVYQCVGFNNDTSRDIPSEVEKEFGEPLIVLYYFTMIPAYGRLLSDGIITALQQPDGKPQICPHADKLKETLAEAKKNGRVVQRLRQLETEEEDEKDEKDENQPPNNDTCSPPRVRKPQHLLL